jgi:hypothetical protein
MLSLLNKLFFSPEARAMKEQSTRLQKMRKAVEVADCAPEGEKKSLSDRIQPLPAPTAQVWKQETVTELDRQREIARLTGLKAAKSYVPGGSRQGLDSSCNFNLWLRAAEA